MPKTVVVLTQELDLTADAVVKALNTRGVPVFRYDTSYFPVNSAISYQNLGDGWVTEIVDSTYGERSVSLEDVASVWYRRPTAFRFDEALTGPFREFAQKESAHGFGGIMSSLPVLWVNRPDRQSRADFKPLQLRVAKECGLRIPKTLITNNPNKIDDFYAECGGSIIYKALNSGLIREPGGWPGGLLTSPVKRLDPELVRRIRFAPCIFQQRVEKAYDLRVTIIGENLFPVRIDAVNEDGSRAVDWRAYPTGAEESLRHAKATIPREIADGLRGYMRALELNYGAADLVVTPTGEHVFLEVNAGGQFAWLDDEVPDLDLREAMADYLAAGLDR
jgi:glutathione synthase/RimK-type ligase-like ATP-grasp enzyme